MNGAHRRAERNDQHTAALIQDADHEHLLRAKSRSLNAAPVLLD
jgi:hypothetical protein